MKHQSRYSVECQSRLCCLQISEFKDINGNALQFCFSAAALQVRLLNTIFPRARPWFGREQQTLAIAALSNLGYAFPYIRLPSS